MYGIPLMTATNAEFAALEQAHEDRLLASHLASYDDPTEIDDDELAAQEFLTTRWGGDAL